MVHPYLRRREGKEEVPSYPKPELERVLGKTLGVPLFQEQAMQVAIVCAGFTPSEADQLQPVHGDVQGHRRRVRVPGQASGGHGRARLRARAFAERTFAQLEGFGSYGFPESHAASFALIAYASSWVKCHHPDVFCAALLNSQPMGFYAPAQVVRDARDHGVEVRPVCVNASRWDCTLEGTPGRGGGSLAVRLGLRTVHGLANAHGAQLVAERGEGPYGSVDEVWRRAGVPAAALERLAEADAFTGLGLDRRAALWAVRGFTDTVLPLFAAAERDRVPAPEVVEPSVVLAPLPAGGEVVADYRSTGLSLRSHPVAFLRDELRRRGMVACADLTHARDGRRVTVPGIVLVRQKPGSAKGVMFITLEDETGVANLVVWPSLFERQRRLVLSAGMLACQGRVQREGEVVHVVAEQLEGLSNLLRSVGVREAESPATHCCGDAVRTDGSADERGPKGVSVRARDIYVPDRRFGSGGIKVPTRDFR